MAKHLKLKFSFTFASSEDQQAGAEFVECQPGRGSFCSSGMLRDMEVLAAGPWEGGTAHRMYPS